MEQQKVAIYPGMFDPVHLGHIDVVRDASKIFSKVIWAVGVNPVKTPMFNIEQRLVMMELTNEFPNVEVAQRWHACCDTARATGEILSGRVVSSKLLQIKHFSPVLPAHHRAEDREGSKKVCPTSSRVV